MSYDHPGKKLAWMGTGAAILAAGVLLGSAAGRRRQLSVSQDVPEPEDLADRPLAAAALADSLTAARRVEQFAGAVESLGARLDAVERSSSAERVEAVWQKVLRLEERLEQIQAERVRIPGLETVVAEAETRLSPRITSLETRVGQHEVAIRQLQAQAAQTEANLQKMIAAVERLTDQISRALPTAPLRMEPKRETLSATPEEGSAEAPVRETAAAGQPAAPPESYDTAEKAGTARWKALGLVGAVALAFLGSGAAQRPAALSLKAPVAVQAASPDSPERRIDAAIVSLTQLLDQQPEETTWKYELGRLHAMKRDWAQAERWYRAVLDDNPHDPRALASLADVLSRDQRP
ncbi:MAG: tetratricopeptide repeat protein [Acidobacteria bacterium]|nr:tetratricopeptide repeat protein [Acidobacteriota bacterium]